MEKEGKIREIHDAHKVIFKEIERVCDKHGIRFFIESGTLLGAVRHGTAIPWDDDADAAMLRSDFEKFRRIVREELSDDFIYVEPSELGHDAIFDFIPRVLMKKSQIREDGPEEQYYGDGIYNHVGIDIFIIDDVHDCAWIHKLTLGMLVVVYGLGMGHRYELDMNDYKGVTKIIVKLLSSIGKHIQAETILKWYDQVSRIGNGRNKKNHRCFYSNFLIGDVPLIYDKRWFAKTIRVKLDGESFPAPENWHRVLKTIYGDYMKLPPKEERQISHCRLDYVKIWE